MGALLQGRVHVLYAAFRSGVNVKKSRGQVPERCSTGAISASAALRAGDLIIGVNGRMLSTAAPYDEAYARGQPGDSVELTIARPGELGPVILHGIFRARPPVQAQEGLAKSSAQQVLWSFPVLFLLVGFAVLFLRLNDPNAWLLALMFCAFAGFPDIPTPLAFPLAARAFAFAHRAIFNGMLCWFFYLFFAGFPMRSPLDRRLPSLKWVVLALGAATVWPALRTGETNFPRVVAELAGERGSLIIFMFARYASLALGMVSLAQNSFLAAVPPEARRKSRVILWGTIAGVLPILIERAIRDFAGYQPSFWLDTGVALVLFLYPLSFAYAVVKHRVMEIPVLLRRSARYVLVQRGFFVMLFIVAASAIGLFTRFFARHVPVDTNIGMALSAVFGVVLIWAAAPLFFADYDDACRRLRYANCGHNPPLLIRASGVLERLGATATVLGLFREWRCGIQEVLLHPGDTLVLYTDGVTEAPDVNGEEFGENRLVEILRAERKLSVSGLLAHIQAVVQRFSGQGHQADDLTLIVAKARCGKGES